MMTREQAAKTAEDLLRAGNIIEAGWVLMLLARAPDGTPQHIINSMKMAFFLGARHMLEALVMSHEQNLSDATMQRVVDDLGKELDAFEAKTFLRSAATGTPH